jgi:hypothetical protein
MTTVSSESEESNTYNTKKSSEISERSGWREMNSIIQNYVAFLEGRFNRLLVIVLILS